MSSNANQLRTDTLNNNLKKSKKNVSKSMRNQREIKPDECGGIGKLFVGATDEFDDVADGYAVLDDDDEQNKSVDSKR